jgi:hypothetical protein
LNRPFMGPAEYKKVRETWTERTASVAALPLSMQLSDGGRSKKARASLFFDSGRDMGKKIEKREITDGRARASTMAVLRQGSIKGTKKCLQWMVNYNTGTFDEG